MILKSIMSMGGLLLLMACQGPPNPVPAAAWSYRDPAAAPARAERLVFAAQNRVEKLYLGIAELLPGGEEPLAAFLKEAHDRNLRVSLVLGQQGWLSAEGRAAALAHVKEVQAFARAQRRAGRPGPAALHLDVEPQAVARWAEDWVKLSHAYLDLLEAVKAELRGELPLEVDIPVWWDRRQLERRGRLRPLCAWVMAVADETVLMDYRNDLGEILDGVEGNLRIAEHLGRRVVVGLAAHRPEDPDDRGTSFASKGGKALRQAMAEVDHELAGRPGYGGLAVFTLEDWQELRP